MSDVKLLPCPFCGGKARVKTQYDGLRPKGSPENYQTLIHCADVNCGVRPFVAWTDGPTPEASHTDAATKWNRRTP